VQVYQKDPLDGAARRKKRKYGQNTHIMPAPKTPSLTTDIIIELSDRPDVPIVLIRRKNPPDGWALPGGFVDVGESTEHAAVREAEEETSLRVTLKVLLGCYSDPGRDPRGHTASVVYVAEAAGEPCAQDDAAGVAVYFAFLARFRSRADPARLPDMAGAGEVAAAGSGLISGAGEDLVAFFPLLDCGAAPVSERASPREPGATAGSGLISEADEDYVGFFPLFVCGAAPRNSLMYTSRCGNGKLMPAAWKSFQIIL